MTPASTPAPVEVCIVGAGQAGLATAYHLRRLAARSGRQPSVVLLDDHPSPGGAWQDMWETLHLFSPASFSSLPGWPMPPSVEATPSAEHVAAYLTAYEGRYDLPVERPVRVDAVGSIDPSGDVDAGAPARYLVEASDGRAWAARWVVNATGSWRRPFVPAVPGRNDFAGRQLHTVEYRSAAAFAGRRVLVVGGGNSGAQIAADLMLHGVQVVWTTQRPPRLLPDDVDGRVLFETATRAVAARAAGAEDTGVGGLGDIVVVPSVKEARDRLGLAATGPIARLIATGAVWPDGRTEEFDTVIWCTGFRAGLGHLRPLGLRHDANGHPVTVPGAEGPGSPAVESADRPGVLFVGYGDWCGAASATLIGVNRAARAAAAAVVADLTAR